MAEYIEREALRDAVESIDWYSVYKGKLTTGSQNTENALYKASSIYEVIDNVPAADVEPVRHGRWVQCFEDWRKQIDGDKCSVCGFEHYGSVISHYHYCQNCGAKMDLGGYDNA